MGRLTNSSGHLFLQLPPDEPPPSWLTSDSSCAVIGRDSLTGNFAPLKRGAAPTYVGLFANKSMRVQVSQVLPGDCEEGEKDGTARHLSGKTQNPFSIVVNLARHGLKGKSFVVV